MAVRARARQHHTVPDPWPGNPVTQARYGRGLTLNPHLKWVIRPLCAHSQARSEPNSELFPSLIEPAKSRLCVYFEKQRYVTIDTPGRRRATAPPLRAGESAATPEFAPHYAYVHSVAQRGAAWRIGRQSMPPAGMVSRTVKGEGVLRRTMAAGNRISALAHSLIDAWSDTIPPVCCCCALLLWMQGLSGAGCS